MLFNLAILYQLQKNGFALFNGKHKTTLNENYEINMGHKDRSKYYQIERWGPAYGEQLYKGKEHMPYKLDQFVVDLVHIRGRIRYNLQVPLFIRSDTYEVVEGSQWLPGVERGQYPEGIGRPAVSSQCEGDR